MAIEYFTDDQVSQLIQRLLRLTTADRLTWRAADDSAYTFVAEVGGTAFSIQSRDSDDLAPHLLSIYSTEEPPRLLQTVDSGDLATREVGWLQDLYEAVKRKTLRLDVVTKNILDDLDRLLQDDEF